MMNEKIWKKVFPGDFIFSVSWPLFCTDLRVTYDFPFPTFTPFLRLVWWGSVFCALGFPAIILLRVTDEMLFSYDVSALWSALSVNLFIDYFLSAGSSVLPWLASILLIKDAVFQMENHQSLWGSHCQPVPVSFTTKAGESGSVPSARIPQIYIGSLLKLPLCSFWMRGDSLNQNLGRWMVDVSQQCM